MPPRLLTKQYMGVSCLEWSVGENNATGEVAARLSLGRYFAASFLGVAAI